MRTPPKLIDAHCHLDLHSDFEEEAARRNRAGIWTLAVTTLPQAWDRNRELAARHAMIEAALGVHPELVTEYPGAIDIWTSLAREARFIGEVGLDGRPRNRSSLAAQTAVFNRVLETCSEQGGKVLTIHSAWAQKEVLSSLENGLDFKRNRVVLHWFVGSAPLFARAKALGCYFSINSAMLESSRVTKQLRDLPRECLLTESDAPFLDAAGATVEATLRSLATAIELPTVEVAALLASNLETLLAG